MTYKEIFDTCNQEGRDHVELAYGDNDPFYCGFAWITIYPGNCRLANQAKKLLDNASPAYGGGVQIWVRDGGNQSMSRRETYAKAYTKKLRELADPSEYKSIQWGSRAD